MREVERFSDFALNNPLQFKKIIKMYIEGFTLAKSKLFTESDPIMMDNVGLAEADSHFTSHNGSAICPTLDYISFFTIC